MDNKITLSTVTPVYSGEKYLRRLVEEIAKLRQKWQDDQSPLFLQEAIFVDDGSIDQSSVVMQELSEQYAWVRVVSLSRNFGQHAATVAGICHTTSDWVVTMDEDMQHPPSLIERLFMNQVNNQSDIVYAHPKSGTHGNSWRDSSSKLVKRLLAKLTSTPQIRLFNSFRLIRGSIARAAASSSSRNTYFDIAISWFTKSYSVVELELVDERFTAAESQAKSGYGFWRLVKHARSLAVSAELDVASGGLILGFASVMVAASLAGFSILQRIFFPETVEIAGWVSTISIITLLGGVIITLLCIALEYLNILLLNNLGRPTFFTIDRSQDHLLKDWIKN